MKSKGKEEILNKEEIAEDWCFVCKEGGDVRICDYKQCLKVYHPDCVGEDDSFLDSESPWSCSWHSCFLCQRTSDLHCYCCPTAVCCHCATASEFVRVKSKYGFCKCCLKLADLIEEERGYDSEGERVDFRDRDTYEGLFREYYLLIKGKEGLQTAHVRAAKDRMKRRDQPVSDPEQFDEYSEEDGSSSSDDKKRRKRQNKDKSGRHKSAIRRYAKSRKREFIGWGSKSLIEFLDSVCISTKEILSQSDVFQIIDKYVKENKLFHPTKKKQIVCDAKLQSLLGKRIVNKHRIFDLLESHFAENQEDSEEDELGCNSEENDADILVASKRPRKRNVEKKSKEEEFKFDHPHNSFASITVPNIKLIYLKRSLVYELLKKPQSFEEKVIGSFVRIKSDPHDYSQRNSHQLVQVKGMRKVYENSDVILQVSGIPKEIRLSLLSDDDFLEEECEDLRQKVMAGLLERSTVAGLQQKARSLHKDITKHWIRKELALLQNLIDRANEKGWRRELFECLERRKKLQTPSEQSRLLENIPKVTPDMPEGEHISGDIIDGVERDEGSPKSILESTKTPSGKWEHNRTSGEKDHRNHATIPESKQTITRTSGSSWHISPSEFKDNSSPHKEHLQSIPEERQNTSLAFHTDKELQHFPNTAPRNQLKKTSRGEADMSISKTRSTKQAEIHDNLAETKNQEALEPLVIELLSDEEDDNGHDYMYNGSSSLRNVAAKEEDLESRIWYIISPDGDKKKGKFSMSVLKNWSEVSPCAFEFKVMKENHSVKDAIWLKDALDLAYPKK